uniref:Uncharacterized protein n=1 Tax=Noctiluca scintillans TaxID=2966 RepID=A0A7S1ABR5_NOCSC
MGNFARCLRPRSEAENFRDVDAQDVVQATVDSPVVCDAWVDAGCALHCGFCLNTFNEKPLNLAADWLRACVEDASLQVPRFADTAVYVALMRILCIVCSPGSLSLARSVAGVAGSRSGEEITTIVGQLYADTLTLLEDSWHATDDFRRIRPFLRLRSGRLLQLKIIVELCFREAFDPRPHPRKLSELAIGVLNAIETQDAGFVWNAVQTLGHPEQRYALIGPAASPQSQAACVMLQLQGLVSLLTHPLRPLERCCPLEKALNMMRSAVADLSANVGPEFSWLGAWQLIDSADRVFRFSCSAADEVLLKGWAVRCAAELAIWRFGDHYFAIVASFAVRVLILWRALLISQPRTCADLSPIQQAVQQALGDVSHCAAQAGSEVKEVTMFLNDHHMAGASHLAAARPCLLHREDGLCVPCLQATGDPNPPSVRTLSWSCAPETVRSERLDTRSPEASGTGTVGPVEDFEESAGQALHPEIQHT